MQLRFSPVRLWVIVGFSLILRLGLGLLLRDGLLGSLSLARLLLWPASWVHTIDKSRDSRSAEVRRIWEIYDERLGLVSVEDVHKINDALSSGDVSGAWVAWSTAAESALVDAFCLAGGPVPERGFCLGRGYARSFGWT